MSSNVQDATPRKRSHDDFAGKDDVSVEDVSVSASTPSRTTSHTLLTAWVSTPRGSATPVDKTSLDATHESPSERTPMKSPADLSTQTKSDEAAVNGQPQTAKGIPAPKRKKRTQAEKEAHDREVAEKKEAKEREAAEKKQEREEKSRIRAEEKAKAEKEKAERAAEKEEKRKKKEEEEKQKAHEKEEKERIKREAAEKKARAQRSLTSFFGSKAGNKSDDTPKSAANEPQTTPSVADATTTDFAEYRRRFRAFNVKENTRLAEPSPLMDEETRALKSKILDEYLTGERKLELDRTFDMMKLFELPQKPAKRGYTQPSVKDIMETMQKELGSCAATGSEADQIVRRTKEKLAKIPINFIAFSRDVRPPYCGTSTYKPSLVGLEERRTLARRPVSRALPLDYDYDSEAEWQEEEEGEDLDADDEEEELDDEDDMDGFLDDSEDAGLARRVFVNTLEPESTGVCFEGSQDVADAPLLQQHRMEYMHESIPNQESIDPWTTSYWQPEQKKAPLKSIVEIKKEGSPAPMAPPPAPANAFAAIAQPSTPPAVAVKLVKDEFMDDVKQAILDNKALSKVGIIDFIFQQFRDRATKAEVKNTIELVAEKTKGAGSRKEWGLKPGHELRT